MIKMVDVGEKIPTARWAKASGVIKVSPQTIRLIKRGAMPKGDVLSAARLAGIMAAKKTSEIIPLCHNIPLDAVDVELKLERSAINITATAKANAKTGVEMEALTAVLVAALTIYDMCKAVDKKMVIGDIRLLEKHGGKSGYIISPQSTVDSP